MRRGETNRWDDGDGLDQLFNQPPKLREVSHGWDWASCWPDPEPATFADLGARDGAARFERLSWTRRNAPSVLECTAGMPCEPVLAVGVFPNSRLEPGRLSMKHKPR